jgi:hypothetical protein
MNIINNELQEIQVSVKLKISALWTIFMFIYIYVDYLHLYMPGSIKDIIAGNVFVFEITQTFLMASLAFFTIPALMIFLSLALPSSANRLTNMILATIYIPFVIFNIAGESWIHMMSAVAVEVALLLLIIRYAWTWPRSGAISPTAGRHQ